MLSTIITADSALPGGWRGNTRATAHGDLRGIADTTHAQAAPGPCAPPLHPNERSQRRKRQVIKMEMSIVECGLNFYQATIMSFFWSPENGTLSGSI